MGIVVASDLGARRIYSGQHQGIEVGISALDPMLCDREVRRGKEVQQCEVGHAGAETVQLVAEWHFGQPRTWRTTSRRGKVACR